MSSHLALVDIGHVDARSIASHKTTVDSIEWRQHILAAVDVMLQLSTYISCQHTMSAPNIYKLQTHNVDVDIYKLSMHTISVSIGTHTDTKCVLSTQVPNGRVEPASTKPPDTNSFSINNSFPTNIFRQFFLDGKWRRHNLFQRIFLPTSTFLVSEKGFILLVLYPKYYAPT